MSKGKNILETYNSYSNNFSRSIHTKPVVFLSHKSEDKDYVEKIGEYLQNAGIDIYLDKYDPNLQCAVSQGNAKKVTQCIQNGIDNSDYILCITSEATIQSWWVPYEIGYGKNADKKIATLIRKDVSYIPDFLKIEKIIEDISDLNIFIEDIAKKHYIPLNEYTSFEKYANTGQIQAASYSHPLSKYLNVR